MKYVFIALVAVAGLMFLAAPATADWDPDDFRKYVQYPDLTGWDVMFTEDGSGLRTVRLADDFPCYETGKITDVHLWFSVGNDSVDPSQVVDKIHLSLHENIPADTAANIPWSRPGELLDEWDFPYDDEKVKIRRWPYDTGLQGFMYPDPEQPDYNPDNHSQIWQANILIDRDAFLQEGTAANPKIYWLDASISLKPGMYAELGWKTSQDFWEPRELDDDAVFWYEGGPDGFPSGWYPLVDPTGESLNLAFVITPEPGTVVMLLGAGLIGLLAYARRRRKS